MTGFAWNTVDLRTMATEIQVVDGWDAFPAGRVETTQYPYMHGEVYSNEIFYEARDISLGMIVLPYNANGTVTLDPLEHVQDNLDALFALFGASGLGSLIRTMPDTTQREARVKVLDAFEVSQGQGPAIKKFVVRARMPIPFWRQLPELTLSGSGTITSGSAPIQDFRIIFSGSGTATNTTNGDSVTATGAVTVDMSTGEIHNGGVPADGLVTPNRPWIFRLGPGANSITLSGASITYYPSWF